jgi:hypothetical protein
VRRQSVAATVLLSARTYHSIADGFVRAKAVSPLRFATALQKAPIIIEIFTRLVHTFLS